MYYMRDALLINSENNIQGPLSRYAILPDGQKITRDNFPGDTVRFGVRPYRIDDVPTGYQPTGWRVIDDPDTPGGLLQIATGVEATQTVEELRAALVAQVKSRAYGLLSPTDWYVTRLAETTESVPGEVTAARSAIRTASDTNEAALAAITDYDEMLAWSAIWPE
jgi:hypothetical protein